MASTLKLKTKPAASKAPAPHAQPPTRPPRQARHDDMHAGRGDRGEHGEHGEHAPGSMRLSKRMSELGLASRREADEWIAKGWVRVDGKVVAELGSRVVPGQRVTV